MFRLYIVLLFFILLAVNVSNSQELTAIAGENSKVSAEQKVQNKGLKTPSVAIDSSDIKNHIPESKFYYANNKRYTIDGSLPRETTKIRPIPATILGTSLVAIFIVQHEMQQNTIWKVTAPFHVAEDYMYTFALDKGGHFYGTYMPSYLLNEMLLASGFSYDLSAILASVLGLCYTGYVEVNDGMSRDFGFSPTDFYADVAGASFFLAQHYVPFLQNFTPKFEYVKPSWIGEKDRYPHDSFIDNYSAQTFWMSVNVHNLLPESAKKYWPKWLELSFGYGVYSLCAPGYQGHQCDPAVSTPVSDVAWGNRKLLIALDYNLVQLIPDTWNFPNWVRQGLNHFRWPSPVLEIGNITRFYLVYPFPIKIGNVRF